MTNRKGFTLIELLAVIVVLAVIAIIAVPVILNVIEKAEKGALKDSAYGLISAAENYYAKNLDNMNSYVLFEIEDSEQVSEKKLEYKGTIDGDAKVVLTKEGKVAVCIVSKNVYAKKEITESEVEVKTATSDVICTLPNIETNNFELSIGGSSSDYYTKEEVDDLIKNKVDKDNVFGDLDFNNISEENIDAYEKRNFSVAHNVEATMLTGNSKYGTINNGVLTFNEKGIYYVSSYLIITVNPNLQLYNRLFINDVVINSSFIYMYNAGVPVSTTFYAEEGDTLKPTLIAYGTSSSVYAWFVKIYKIM